MKQENLFPPARLSQEHDAEHCMKQAKKCLKESLANTAEAGRWLLSAKEQCSYGQWGDVLAKYGLSRTTAHRIITKAKEDTEFEEFMSGQLSSEIENLFQVEQVKSTSEEAEQTYKNEKNSEPRYKTRCRPCRMLSSPPEKCKVCDAQNKPLSAAVKPPKAEQPERESGADEPEPHHKMVKQVESLQKVWAKRLLFRSRLHDLPKNEVERIGRALNAVVEGFKRLLAAPLKPAEPPREGKCKHCGADILWVTTESGANMPLDAKAGGGSFELIDNRPVKVQWTHDLDSSRLYRSHFNSCTRKTR